MSAAPRTTGRLTHIAFGFAAWAVVFVLIYGMQAVGCRLGWDRIELFGALSLQRLQQITLYFGGIVALVLLYAWCRRHSLQPQSQPTDSFLETVSTYGAMAACGAVTLSFAGVLWLTAC